MLWLERAHHGPDQPGETESLSDLQAKQFVSEEQRGALGERERVHRLGLVPTRAEGRFEAALRVPPEVSPGRYGLAARYLGLTDTP